MYIRIRTTQMLNNSLSEMNEMNFGLFAQLSVVGPLVL